MELLFVAFLLGASGSLHCVGMCGPIALALPVHHLPFTSRTLLLFLYHAGRILCYATLGFIFSFFGAGLVLAGIQQSLSIALGSLLIVSVLFARIKFTKRFALGLGPFFKQHLGAAIRKKTPSALFLAGMLNGLLPCGLLYTALAGATASRTITDGVLFMVVFGLGTLPAMLSIGLLSTISPQMRQVIRKASPVITVLMGILLVIRGLGLGIPMLSPANNKPGEAQECAQPTKEQPTSLP
ncbi:MAG: sulfite exporter TauE/SafE family protein [Bacteroidia bacterium]|jgi:sulfite exporter TauE/SafE|nr:sulfite exporter TauE/SafE family protein [Bacteroidia bacterium]